MNFKLSYSNFELLNKYIEKKAKGADLTLSVTHQGQLEVKLSNTAQEQVIITLFEDREGGASLPKIAVTRRLGDEI